MRVFIVDDHPVVRLGLKNMLQAEPDIVVCGEAETAQGALDGVAQNTPDVVLVDISLAHGDGLSLVESISALYPRLKILVVSMHEESVFAGRALHAGAHGYVMKSRAATSVVDGVRGVHRGEIFVSPEFSSMVLNQLVGGATRPGPSGIDALSNREMSIYLLIGDGKSSKEIAEELHLSVKTVETHRSRIRVKLGLADGMSLVRSAIAWAQSEAGQARRAQEHELRALPQTH